MGRVFTFSLSWNSTSVDPVPFLTQPRVSRRHLTCGLAEPNSWLSAPPQTSPSPWTYHQHHPSSCSRHSLSPPLLPSVPSPSHHQDQETPSLAPLHFCSCCLLRCVTGLGHSTGSFPGFSAATLHWHPHHTHRTSVPPHCTSSSTFPRLAFV